MALDIKAPQNVILQPTITVFGVGGAGGNAINNMIKSNLKGANFVVANTDAQALEYSDVMNKIQLGATSTKGLGAGANPEIGKKAAEESENELRSFLEDSNMVFITAGMGGGTGTGASPIIAKIAKELNILTVGVVTKPFIFEGAKRMRLAEEGIKELQQYVDTLIIIPNQNLFRIANENTTFQDAFFMADEVLHAGVRGVTDLITSPGLVNLDFADIETVMSEKGKAMMGTGEASGEDRAIKAAESAIANPLIDQSSMCGACGVLINITGGKDMTLYEVDSAANRIREEVGDSEANIIFGSTFNPDLEGAIRVSVVATGIEQDKIRQEKDNVQQKKDNANHSPVPEINSKSLADNVSIDDHEPSNFNEYGSDLEASEAELNERLRQLSKQVKWDIEDASESKNSSKNQDLPIRKLTKKKSLFKKMWSSLLGVDDQDENYEIQSNPNSDDSQEVKEKPNLVSVDQD